MKQVLEIGRDSLRLGGEPFFLVSGSLHYFRILPYDWKRRLELAKDLAYNQIHLDMVEAVVQAIMEDLLVLVELVLVDRHIYQGTPDALQ